MKALAVLLVLIVLPAAAQTTRNQAASAGVAGVNARLQAQGYHDIQNLHRTPDGRWVGTATQNGVEKNVTVMPDSTTIAR